MVSRVLPLRSRSSMARSSAAGRVFDSSSRWAATRRLAGSTSMNRRRARSASWRSTSMRLTCCRSTVAKSARICSRTGSARAMFRRFTAAKMKSETAASIAPARRLWQVRSPQPHVVVRAVIVPVSRLYAFRSGHDVANPHSVPAMATDDPGLQRRLAFPRRGPTRQSRCERGDVPFQRFLVAAILVPVDVGGMSVRYADRPRLHGHTDMVHRSVGAGTRAMAVFDEVGAPPAGLPAVAGVGADVP